MMLWCILRVRFSTGRGICGVQKFIYHTRTCDTRDRDTAGLPVPVSHPNYKSMADIAKTFKVTQKPPLRPESRPKHGERLAAVAKLGCMDKQYKKLGGKEYCRRQAAKMEKRDYELEWEVYKASQKDKMCQKVADALWVPTGQEKHIARQDGSYSATDRLDLESAENVIPIRAMDATGHLDPHQYLATHATAGFARVSKFCDTGISPPLPPLVSTRIRKFCDTGTPPPMPGPVIGEEGALPPLPRVHNYSLDLRRHQKIILS
ncbi:hypothetical protein C8R47DRAFT_1082130 [Mycena vitilis]|nr:hypothetical protein C8R47DRAFT_1082130 [Mycena vitilis]